MDILQPKQANKQQKSLHSKRIQGFRLAEKEGFELCWGLFRPSYLLPFHPSNHCNYSLFGKLNPMMYWVVLANTAAVRVRVRVKNTCPDFLKGPEWAYVLQPGKSESTLNYLYVTFADLCSTVCLSVIPHPGDRHNPPRWCGSSPHSPHHRQKSFRRRCGQCTVPA